MRSIGVQCLLFVLNRTECFVVIPSVAIEKHPKVCHLFTQNNVTILNPDEEYPLLQQNVDKVKVLELIVWSGFDDSECEFHALQCNCPFESTLSVGIDVEEGNIEFVRRLFGFDADVDKLRARYHANRFTLIDNRSLKSIDRLLRCRANIKYRHPLGGTILHLAIRRRNKALVRLLLNHDINIDAVRKDGSTALHFIAADEPLLFVGCDTKLRMVYARLLLQKHAAVNAKKEDGSTSLLFASRKGDLQMVKLLLKNGADVNIGNHDGLTPLHAAAKSGEVAVVNELLKRSANINATVSYHYAKGVTPLSVAVEEGHLAVVARLLKKGADPNIPCYDDQTIPRLAADRVRILSDYIRGIEKIVCKTVFPKLRDRKKIAKLLCEHGFNLDAEGRKDIELLHDAIWKNDYTTVEGLLKSGANVNKVYGYFDGSIGRFRNVMPLNTAVYCRANDIAELLIRYGADEHVRFILDEIEFFVDDVYHPNILELLLLLWIERKRNRFRRKSSRWQLTSAVRHSCRKFYAKVHK